MTIQELLTQKPTLSQILEYVEQEAQRIAAERRKAGVAQK